jgi:hypothetical protein
MESSTLTESIKNNNPLHKIIFKIVNTLLMNETEIVYFALYLDKLGWTTEGLSLKNSLLITAFFSKVK